VEKIVSFAKENILIDEGIIARMHELIEIGGNPMDSLHIACAEKAGAFLLTTDDDLVTFFKSYQSIHIRIENPVMWLKEMNP
jgi:hypothetical protein